MKQIKEILRQRRLVLARGHKVSLIKAAMLRHWNCYPSWLMCLAESGKVRWRLRIQLERV